MKYKNYKSAIHNLSHSFQSVDYRISSELVFNILVELNNNNINSSTTFDFINKTIEPKEADNLMSHKLMEDYLSWLPEHFSNHNCDLSGLEKLIIKVDADFKSTFTPERMKWAKQICIETQTVWKAFERDEELVNIVENVVVNEKFMESGFPKM